MAKFDKYIGIPYKNLGRDFDGIDCYGLVYLIFKNERGIVLPDYTELKYDKKWYKNSCESHITDNISTCATDRGMFVKATKPYREYDCIIFYSGSRIANHIGLYIGNDKFIHCLEERTSEIDRVSMWNKYIYGHMRYIEGNNIV